jgi:hypothetical protein
MGFGLTNATKAVIAGVVSAFLNLLVAFGVPILEDQQTAINLFVDALLVAWIAFTYKDSPTRSPDADA